MRSAITACLILTFAASNAADDADEVLAAGPPALTRSDLARITMLMEWILDARMTPQERDLLRKSPDSAGSRLLLSMYDRAHATSSTAPS